MVSRTLSRVLCLLALVGVLASIGCYTDPFSPKRMRMRQYSICADVDHLWDDIDWALGLDEPSIVYEQSFPPYSR